MKKSYPVLNPIRFNGRDYPVGSSIDLEEAEVADLLGAAAIEDSPTEIAAPTAPADEAARTAAVVAAIGQLDIANPGQWMKDGKPKTDALSAITGWPVSAADRDAAWATGAGRD